MLPEIQMLTDAHPVRNSKKQKDAFLEDAAALLNNAGYDARISEDPAFAKNHNFIAGELDGARLIYTAHYDTPPRMIFPANTLFPKSALLTFLLQLIMIVVPMALAGWLAGLVLSALGVSEFWQFELRMLAALLAMVLLFFAFPNKHNVNDNTSGVAAVLETALTLPEDQRKGIAFVLFDNEELGLLGSMGFAKKYRKEIRNATVVNLDCVGVGDEIRFIMSKSAAGDARLKEALEQSLAEESGKHLQTVSGKGWFYPSDQKNFHKHVAVAAFIKGRMGLYMSNIHVDWDRHYDEKNHSAVVRTLIALKQNIAETSL